MIHRVDHNQDPQGGSDRDSNTFSETQISDGTEILKLM